jgi:hypothetical protein
MLFRLRLYSGVYLSVRYETVDGMDCVNRMGTRSQCLVLWIIQP